MIKPITPEELLKNRFIEIVEVKSINPNADVKSRKMFKVIEPTRIQAEKFHLRTLALYVGVSGLNKVTKERATKAANYWMSKGKQAILDQFFPLVKDTSLNSIF